MHRCKFTSDNVHVVSFSDDKSVALWDIPSEKEIVKYSEHSVRYSTINITDIYIYVHYIVLHLIGLC